MQATLDVCRELYNAALQERREAWSSHRKGIYYVQQAKQLPDIKTVREDVGEVHSQVLQDALRRIDKAFRAFFLRCQRGQVPGFPRFRSESRYDSFTYPQAGFKLSGRLSLSKIGDIKIKLHRAIQGQIKTLNLKRENGMWYACFSCMVEPEPLPANDKAVGLDVGLLSFVTRSDGRRMGNPRLFQKAQKRLSSKSTTTGSTSREVLEALEESGSPGGQDSPQSFQPTQRFSAPVVSKDRQQLRNHFCGRPERKRSVPWPVC